MITRRLKRFDPLLRTSKRQRVDIVRGIEYAITMLQYRAMMAKYSKAHPRRSDKRAAINTWAGHYKKAYTWAR